MADDPTPEETAAKAAADAAAATAKGTDGELLTLVQKLQKQLDQVTGQLGQYQSKDDADRQKKLADKGEYEKLIKERDEKLAGQAKAIAERDLKFKKGERDRAVTAAIAGTGLDLVKGAPEQLLSLWAHEFEATEADDGSGTFRVLTKDFKTPQQVVTERLASADFEHFVKAASRGKGAGRDGSRPAGTGAAPEGGPPKPASVLDWIVSKQAADAAPGGPQYEKPTGFRRPPTSKN